MLINFHCWTHFGFNVCETWETKSIYEAGIWNRHHWKLYYDVLSEILSRVFLLWNVTVEFNLSKQHFWILICQNFSFVNFFWKHQQSGVIVSVWSDSNRRCSGTGGHWLNLQTPLAAAVQVPLSQALCCRWLWFSWKERTSSVLTGTGGLRCWMCRTCRLLSVSVGGRRRGGTRCCPQDNTYHRSPGCTPPLWNQTSDTAAWRDYWPTRAASRPSPYTSEKHRQHSSTAPSC